MSERIRIPPICANPIAMHCFTWLFVIVGHNATDKGGLSRHQHVDQVVQLISEVAADGFEVGHLCGGLGLHHDPLLSPPMSWGRQVLFLLGLARMIHVDFKHEGAGL